uniref:Uncharacterized protein n=1 Tax=Pyrodinium bahamense TaxID=73915 RepID=A0A7S0FEU6_9DINO|mmetsp:Transcript_26876/g.73929  ORF Transcript_26876/g.73929 Transcript_26876/m.73929 type:complete len:372 (+) Transcript_26876:699-1814(+)
MADSDEAAWCGSPSDDPAMATEAVREAHEAIKALQQERDQLTAQLAAERLKTRLWCGDLRQENPAKDLQPSFEQCVKDAADQRLPTVAMAAANAGLHRRLEAFLAASRRRLHEQRVELDDLEAHVALAAEVVASPKAASPEATNEDSPGDLPPHVEVQRLQETLAEARGRLRCEERRRSEARAEADVALRSLEACQSKLAASREEMLRLEQRIEELHRAPLETAAGATSSTPARAALAEEAATSGLAGGEPGGDVAKGYGCSGTRLLCGAEPSNPVSLSEKAVRKESERERQARRRRKRRSGEKERKEKEKKEKDRGKDKASTLDSEDSEDSQDEVEAVPERVHVWSGEGTGGAPSMEEERERGTNSFHRR